MTISSPSASRRYFERSSFTSDSATCFIALTVFLKPGVRLGFRDNRQDLDLVTRDVIEDPDVVTDAQTVLRVGQSAEPLDPALARLGGLVPQVLLHRVSDLRPDVCLE